MTFPISKTELFVRLAVGCSVAACLLSAAIAQTPTHTSSVILARGPGDTSVSTDDVLSQIQSGSPAEQRSFLGKTESVRMLVENLLVRRVLADEALKNGVAREPLVAATLAVASDQVLSEVSLKRLDAKNEPSEGALEAYARNVYSANSSKYEIPAKTRARHILLPACGQESLTKANALLAQLRAGASFEELAKANSIDKGSANTGGDLGFFSAGTMAIPFEVALAALDKPGDLSEPVQTEFGYHIIRLEERQPKGVQPFESVRNKLIAEARQALLKSFRSQTVQDITKHFVFDAAAINAIGRLGNRP